MTRYALYFAFAPDSRWWHAGCRWLGRDAASGVRLSQPSVPGVPPLLLERLTSDARRYGFHATLKTPFRLCDGFREEHLALMAQAFADVQSPVALEDLQVRALGDFLALRPSGSQDMLGALAMRCVSYFDELRTAPTPAELAKRHRSGLSARQESLLQRWGYPYTEEEFRFHMTLTDSLAAVEENAAYAIRKEAEQCFAEAAQQEPPVLDALTIFREDVPGASFTAWKRFPFRAQGAESALPQSGRLFFIVGPSGAGKDSLLDWVRERTGPRSGIVFARRTITRTTHTGEMHESVDSGTFWRLAASGHFAMFWEANGLCYGVRRSIEAQLKAGKNVIVNGSREYLPKLRESFPDAQIVWIDANAELLRQRIAQRQRESGPALLRRLDHAAAQFVPPENTNIIRLDNNGPIEVAGRQLLELLSADRC